MTFGEGPGWSRRGSAQGVGDLGRLGTLPRPFGSRGDKKPLAIPLQEIVPKVLANLGAVGLEVVPHQEPASAALRGGV